MKDTIPAQTKKILETERLVLRELVPSDLPAMCRVLQDKETMYAYEHAFSDEEAQAWLNNQLRRYRELIGQCGLTWQQISGERLLEVGYLFERVHWHKGYATEAALACKEYAFSVLGMQEVYSIIRDNNFASQRVAQRNGMNVCGKTVKFYYGMEMPHLIFRAVRGR